MVVANTMTEHPSRNQVKTLWRQADCVCFDIDSTVCCNEAIDELAVFAGVEEEVKRITAEAMGSGLCFRDALERRLAIIRPSLSTIEKFNVFQKDHITPGVKELIDMLHERGVEVFFISGGFRKIIVPVAELLGVKTENIFANTLLFSANGDYMGFDKTELTSESGGKGKAVEVIKAKHGYKRLLLIGDGMTDLEASPPADGFIGFGGNVVRQKVKDRAAWFVTDFQELMDELIQIDIDLNASA